MSGDVNDGISGPDIDLLTHTPIDTNETLRQLLGAFRGVRAGLPELIKNSKDQYARVGVNDRNDRQIVVIASTKKSALAVIDFAGAARDDFDRWKTWSDTKASQSANSTDIEGGHGNGGKGFMVKGTIDHSFMESVAGGRRTKMGFQTERKEKLFDPGYYRERGIRIDNVIESDARKRLDEVLKYFGLSFADLPPTARAAFEKRQAFTAVEINGIAEWRTMRTLTVKARVAAIADELRRHPQSALSLETCSVWVIADRVRNGDVSLERSRPDPRKEFESLSAVPVPQVLPDPDTGEAIDTGVGDGAQKYLQLFTSRTHLRGTENKSLNVIRLRNERNVVGSLQVANLVPQNESAYIYGDLRVPVLSGEHLVGADRKGWNDTPLTRALGQWLSMQIEELAVAIQKSEARSHKPEERDKANDSLRRLRELMRRFLDPEGDVGAEGGDGLGKKGTEGVGPNPPPPRAVPRGATVNLIELEANRVSIAMAAGTSIPLVVRCFEVDVDGQRKPVQGISVDLCFSNDLGLSLDAKNRLTAEKSGESEVWIRDKASGLESNHVGLEVIDCNGVDILDPGRTTLMQGERLTVRASFHSSAGPREHLLVEGSIDETGMATYSRSCVLVTGGSEGDVTIRVRFGPKSGDFGVLKLQVGPDVYPAKRRGSQDGGDVPFILLCGTLAPGMDDVALSQRSHSGGEHEPTIIMNDPLFEDIVWINPDSKESNRVRRGRGGRRGTAGIASQTFVQFLALKCFEVLKLLKVRQVSRDQLKTELEFRTMLGDAERECADFIDAAYELADQLREAAPSSEAEA